MKTRVAYLVLPVACVLSTATADAQTLYKSTMPDGRIIFSDVPAPGAAKVDPVQGQVPSPGPRRETAKPDPASQARKAPDPAVVKMLREDKLRRERAEASIRAAEKTLRAAETALANGAQPLPGERVAQPDGRMQLTQVYWARQRKLKDEVEEARANVEREKYRARSAR